MHKKETYEEIITGKLGALSAPGLEDLIWQRIERELDLEMPEGGDDLPGAPAGPAGGFTPGLLVFFSALLLSYFYFLQPALPQLPLLPSENTVSEPATPSNDRTTQPSPPGTSTPAAVPVTTAAAPVRPPGDTASVQPVLQLPQDTVFLPPPGVTAPMTALVPSVVPRKDSLPARRARGTQGISDTAYRIAPVKN